MATNTAIQSHQEWLGFVQPVGLVVSIPALDDSLLQMELDDFFGHNARIFKYHRPDWRISPPLQELFLAPRCA